MLGEEGLEGEGAGVLHLLLLSLALLVLDDAAPASSVGVGMGRGGRGYTGIHLGTRLVDNDDGTIVFGSICRNLSEVEETKFIMKL